MLPYTGSVCTSTLFDHEDLKKGGKKETMEERERREGRVRKDIGNYRSKNYNHGPMPLTDVV